MSTAISDGSARSWQRRANRVFRGNFLNLLCASFTCVLLASAALNLIVIRRDRALRTALAEAPHLTRQIEGRSILLAALMSGTVEKERGQADDLEKPAVVVVVRTASLRSFSSVAAWERLVRQLPPHSPVWLLSFDGFTSVAPVIELLETLRLPYRLLRVTSPSAFVVRTGIHDVPITLALDASLSVRLVASGELTIQDADRFSGFLSGRLKVRDGAEITFAKSDSISAQPGIADVNGGVKR